MVATDVTSEEVQTVLKGKKVLIIGDSICRGMYKDLACLLHGNDRLLKPDELIFNRHNKNNKYALFDEIIDHFKVDRSNSINNIERRKLVSTEHDYHIQYWFCSRIWNKSMEELSLSIEQYDCVFIQSLIYDLSRYHDFNGQLFLQNLHICISNMKK
ncbi:unnamed protein product [Rotaria magnacalcarata]|uniref:Uncharacterized protein n=1 Tax=Rotaria magnacalcarata TaxID=392030 RepID=A0A816VLY5_9BILA|nr:unnamed protein product [Rotaria magnacalcarata]